MFSLLRNLLAIYGMYRLYQDYFRPAIISYPPDDGVFRVTQEMPLFGLTATAYPLPDYKQAQRAATERMLEFIYERLSYPAAARTGGHEGTAVVNFIVETDGSIRDIKLMRDPGYGMGDAALEVVRTMQSEGPKWRPGYQHGRPVPVQFAMPIRFKP